MSHDSQPLQNLTPTTLQNLTPSTPTSSVPSASSGYVPMTGNPIQRFFAYMTDQQVFMQNQLQGTPGSPGLMQQINKSNAELNKINDWLNSATQGQQANKKDQPIPNNLVKYLEENHNGTYDLKPETKDGKPVLGKNGQPIYQNSYIKYDSKTGQYEVKDPKQWQTIATTLNGDSTTQRNKAQMLTINVNSTLSQFQNTQQAMTTGIQGIASADSQDWTNING